MFNTTPRIGITYTLDITSVPNYQNLTTDNIKVGFNGFYTRQNATGGSRTLTKPTFSYDASTGIVTLGRDNTPSTSDQGFGWIVVVCTGGFITT